MGWGAVIDITSHCETPSMVQMKREREKKEDVGGWRVWVLHVVMEIHVSGVDHCSGATGPVKGRVIRAHMPR